MKKNRNMNKMIAFLMIFFLFFFTVISGRFFYIQATGEVDDVSLLEWANEKREAELVIKAKRGKIFDQNGSLLAYDRPTYRLFAVLNPEVSVHQKEPLHVVDVEKTAKELAPFLQMEETEISAILKSGQKEKKWQVEFGKNGKNLSQQAMEEIKALQLSGINFMEESVRYYANGVFASHIIGFTRPNEETNELAGVIGIENEYDKMLSGTDGFIRYQRDKYNKKLLHSKDNVKKAENGYDLYLTLNEKIQVLLEDVLSEVDERYEPERMSATVMNPKTGEILALGNRPSFNPNQIDDLENWYNDAISTPFEPGSTAKIFTWAAAIDSGNYNGSETFQSGKYKVNQKIETINDHNQGKGWGAITYDEGFRRSSNVAASKLMWEKMGSDVFYEYLKRFDFDEKTDIDLPSEEAGQILYNWPSEKLRTSFGQGSTVTQLQQMKAATAIVNDGKMMRPFVVKKIVDPETGKVIEENKPKIVGEPIKKETAKQVIELLEAVVNQEGGTGREYQLQEYSVIGKTGTAQIPNPNGAGYLTGRENYIFSFIGMAPKEDPQLMIHVAVKQPKLKPTETGSAPVAYVFKNMMENGLRYLNIEPDKETPVSQLETHIFPNVMNQEVEKVIKDFEKLGVEAVIVGTGKKVKGSNFEEGTLFYRNERVIIITEKPAMPDITGWSQRDVLQLVELLGLEVEVKGHGYAVNQSIKPSEPVGKAQLHVEFKDPRSK